MSTPRVDPLASAVQRMSAQEPDRAAAARDRLVAVIVFAALGALFAVAGYRAAAVFGRRATDPLGEVLSSVPALGAIGIGVLLVLAVVEFVDRRGYADPETSRKIAHVGAGLVAFFVPVAFSSHWPVLVSALAFTLLLVGARRYGFLAPLHSPGRHSVGDMAYPASLYLVYLLADGNPVLYQVPVLVLAVADASAALVGRRFGRVRFWVAGSMRSLEGSLAFFVAAIGCIVAPLVVASQMAGAQALLGVLAVAAAATFAEAVAPKGLDNLSVPIATALLLDALRMAA